MMDVFISCKREERARWEWIAKKLKALNLDVWFDARLPSGKSFDREIESTMKKAKAVLGSARSAAFWLRRSWRRANCHCLPRHALRGLI